MAVCGRLPIAGQPATLGFKPRHALPLQLLVRQAPMFDAISLVLAGLCAFVEVGDALTLLPRQRLPRYAVGAFFLSHLRAHTIYFASQMTLSFFCRRRWRYR